MLHAFKIYVNYLLCLCVCKTNYKTRKKLLCKCHKWSCNKIYFLNYSILLLFNSNNRIYKLYSVKKNKQN